MREGVPFGGRLSGLEVVSEDVASPLHTAGVPEFPTLAVTSPNSRKGRKDLKGMAERWNSVRRRRPAY
jgi:hypothetical protein